MKQYVVEYRKTSDYTDLIEIDTIKLDDFGHYGIVTKTFGYKHPDGMINVYPGHISECWHCNSIICSIEHAKEIYQYETEILDSWYSLQ